jgi:hypothetical protein
MPGTILAEAEIDRHPGSPDPLFPDRAAFAVTVHADHVAYAFREADHALEFAMRNGAEPHEAPPGREGPTSPPASA